MRIIDYGEYLSGNSTFEALEGVQYPNIVVQCTASYFLHEYELDGIVEQYNHPVVFYREHPEVIKLPVISSPETDIEFQIKDNRIYTCLPAEEFKFGFYNEVFYAMCVGKKYKELYGIPCKQLFYLDKFAEMFKKEFVWLPKVYPEKLLTALCSEGYIKSDKTPAALINTLFDVNYTPLTSTSRCAAGEDGWFYAYVGNVDTLVRIPPVLKSVLTPADIFSLHYEEPYVRTSRKPIHEYIPGCRGIYLSRNSYDVDVI